MQTLPFENIRELLQPFWPEMPQSLAAGLSLYLDLLMKWNARTNLTAVRKPEEIVTHHFGESLFLAHHIEGGETLLDIGSGAGFPGIPVQLACPWLSVTVAESQNKKAAFLREVVRQLGIGAEVWSTRVEEMPAERHFSVVAWRAVDRAEFISSLAEARVARGGKLMQLRTGRGPRGMSVQVPGSRERFLTLMEPDVPRGTVI